MVAIELGIAHRAITACLFYSLAQLGNARNITQSAAY